MPELSPELSKTHPGKVEGRHSRQKELRGEAQGLESKGCVHEYKDLDITGWWVVQRDGGKKQWE